MDIFPSLYSGAYYYLYKFIGVFRYAFREGEGGRCTIAFVVGRLSHLQPGESGPLSPSLSLYEYRRFIFVCGWEIILFYLFLLLLFLFYLFLLVAYVFTTSLTNRVYILLFFAGLVHPESPETHVLGLARRRASPSPLLSPPSLLSVGPTPAHSFPHC
jgi:hypothetical protein